MKYFSKSALACLMFLLAGNGIYACELPAHPNAAAMPVSITPKGGSEIPIKDAGKIVKLVSDSSTGNFYYLIPEGSKVKMKIVWDPMCHNSGATGKDWDYKKEQYDYLNDGHIEGVKPDNEVQAAGGYNFFPLSAMSEFFKVSGNRNDIEEAFGREMKVSTSDQKVADEYGVGPGTLYTNTFAKASTELVIKLTGKKSSNYKDDICDKAVLAKDNTYAVRPVLDEYEKTESLNAALPGIHMNGTIKEKIYILENDKLKLQKFKNGNPGMDATKIENSEDLIVYSDSGLEVRNISIALKNPKYEDYKAYIAKNKNNHEIHVEGIDYNSEKPIATGENNGYFNVTFTTPSIDGNGNEDDAVLKIRVNSPAAGYEMNNVFWVWKEQYYERTKEDKKYTVEGDDEVTEINPSTDTNCLVYKKKGGLKKCSCETMVTFNKAQDAFGYSGYKIYDDCGPISTNLDIANVNESLSFAESDGKAEKTTFKYRISLIDSNPFIEKEIAATGAEKDKFKDISQNKDRMEVTFYYNYPVYKYRKHSISSLDNLKGCGLVDFADNNKSGVKADFRTYDYDVQWYWKKAVDVKIDSLKNDEIYKDIATNRVIGSKSTIEGTFTIDNPKPWHITEDFPLNPDGSNFAVFAVLKDTAGNTHLTEVYKANKTETELASANPEDANNFNKKKLAVYPNESSTKIITANLDEKTAPSLVDDLKGQESWDTSYWQNIEHLKSNDKTAPEIQIIVYDTRTNHYHIFGTSDNVAAGFNKFTDTTHTNYASVIDTVPYIGRNTAISNSYLYNTFENMDKLYDAFLKVNVPDYKAISTIEEPLNKNGFVCQKGSRLIFYVHAFDNIGFKEPSNQGVSTLEVKLVDCADGNTGEAKTLTDGTYFENVFRQENYDKNGNLKAGMQPYKVLVTAKDNANPVNERNFELDIAVLGRTLDIRTLEEKRERVE